MTYTYNGDGLKTRRVGPNGTTNYYYDGIRPIWETNSTGAMTAQYDRDIFGNLLSRKDSTNARWYFHHDGLGSTTAVTNGSGAVSATILYDAWGNQRTSTGSGHGNYRFAGTELDTTTGLYHMGARFYDPTIGRWLNEDPVQDKPFEPVTLNFYAYVANNPALLADPNGTMPYTDPTDASTMTIADRVRDWIDKGLDAPALLKGLWERINATIDATSALGTPIDLTLAVFLAGRLPSLVTKGLIRGLYTAAAVELGMGLLVESLGFWESALRGKSLEWIREALRRGLIDLALGTFLVGYWLDSSYYGGSVWKEFSGNFDPRGWRRR